MNCSEIMKKKVGMARHGKQIIPKVQRFGWGSEELKRLVSALAFLSALLPFHVIPIGASVPFHVIPIGASVSGKGAL